MTGNDAGSLVVGGLFLVFGAGKLLYDRWSERRNESPVRERLRFLQEEVEKAAQSRVVNLADDVARVLDQASEQQRLLLVKSEGRLQRLYGLGTTLVLLSVFVPFILVSIYLSTDQIPLIAQLTQRGVDAKAAAELAHRDWHLLVAGVSFGLLFLAAAKGLVSAESRHRETYFALSRRVNYYADMSSALRLADRLDIDSKAGGGTRQQAVRLLINQLLVGVKDQGVSAMVSPPEKESLIPEVVTTLTSLTARQSP